jgi:predicted HTH domain antitoxin
MSAILKAALWICAWQKSEFIYDKSMMVDIPESIAQFLPRDPNQRARSILEALVIGAYTEGLISRGRAVELLGLNYWTGEEFFRQRGVCINYNIEEFRRDIGA